MISKPLVWLCICLFGLNYSAGNEMKSTKHDCKQRLNDINLPSIQDFRDLVQKFCDKVILVVHNADPFTTDQIDFNYHAYGIKSEGYLKELHESGLSSVKLNYLNVTEDPSLQFVIKVSVEHLQFIGSYILNFNILTMLPIYGSGDLGIAVNALYFYVNTTLKEMEDKTLQITNFQMNFGIDNAKVDISSIFNSTDRGEYLSSLMTALLPQFLNEYPPLKTYGSIGVKAALNSIMCDQRTTLNNITDVMQHFIE